MSKEEYELHLSVEMPIVHNEFHMSMLRKYIQNPDHALMPQTVQVQAILSYEEKPVEILDSTVKKLRNKEISLVKDLWRKP